MRRIDDGGEFAHAIHAQIGDGAGAALVFVRLELLGAGAFGKVAHFGRDRGQRFGSALRITGVIRPPSIATAMPMSECVKRKMRSSAHTALAAGTRCSAAAQALMMKSLSESLNAGCAVLALRRGGVGLLAHGDEPADIQIGGQIEMRDGLLGLDQPLGDGRAHPVERHFLVGDALVQRLDLRRAGAGGHRRRGRRRLLDVGGNDAAMRAGAAEARQVDAAFAGEPPRERRGEGAAGQFRRPVIALGRAHFAEGIHMRIGMRCVCSPLVPAHAGTQAMSGSGPPLSRG